MSSYNLVNGVHTSESKDLLTNILRGEWGFRGIVTTDWWTHGEHYREAKAGNDIKMANGYPERVMEALEKGYITKEEFWDWRPENPVSLPENRLNPEGIPLQKCKLSTANVTSVDGKKPPNFLK